MWCKTLPASVPPPEAIVCEFPGYCGSAFYANESHWAHILPMLAAKEGPRLASCQFPLTAGLALTVNKAQGLTVKDGVVIHFVGDKRFWPAAKHGLPFAAWRRSESFAMTCPIRYFVPRAW